MTKDQVPEATEARLIALDTLRMIAIRTALDARGATGEAIVVQTADLPADQAVLFVGAAVFAQLDAIRDEGRQALAEGLAETAISRAAEKDLVPSQF